ncbi:hypothetical protein MRX96_058336 [Rhipicephalus microplus]
MRNPKASHFPVLAIAVARRITELELAELITSSFELSPAAAQAPAHALTHTAPPLSPPERVLGADNRFSCKENFNNSELQRWKPRKSWHSAVVVAALKRGKPSRELKSFRPISLTSEAGKTMNVAFQWLQWLTAPRSVFECEQCDFGPGRATAVCLGAVVSALEQTLYDGEMAILLLLEVQSAFVSLPYAYIISAVRALCVEGELLNYVQAFLTGRDVFCARWEERQAHRVPSTLVHHRAVS